MSMGVLRPKLVMKSIIPVVMAGVLGIYGLTASVIISEDLTEPAKYPHYQGFAHLGPTFSSIMLQPRDKNARTRCRLLSAPTWWHKTLFDPVYPLGGTVIIASALMPKVDSPYSSSYSPSWQGS